MPDVVVLGLNVAQWLALALAAGMGVAAGWLVVMFLLYPQRQMGIPGLMPFQGQINARAADITAFAQQHLLVGMPPPRRFFEQLGPDRFRREFARALKERLDEHVDDVMTRRNGNSWEALSDYARGRIYAHVHRRLPYVVDDFVDHLQHDLNDIVHPSVLVRRHFESNPEQLNRAFVECFGADLRAALLLAGLVAGLLALPVVFLADGVWHWVLIGGFSALGGSLIVLLRMSWPVEQAGIWPLRTQGILHRNRQRFVQALADQIVDGALSWRAIVGEFLKGAHAGRVRHMMRREVAAILDVPLFRTSMQLLLGPEGFAEVKSSAVEKAVELLAAVPISAALREHYRFELQRTIGYAASRVAPEHSALLWQRVLERTWRVVPMAAMVIGGAAGWAIGWLAGPG